MLEEEVLDTHKMVMDQTTRFLNDAHSVFSVTHEVDYDQEGKTIEQHLPIDHSKTPLYILYPYSYPRYPARSRIPRMHAYIACTYASTHNESVYIYISSHLVSTCIRCIYVSLSHACVIVPLYSFVSFPKRFKLVLFFFFSFPFRISLFFVFTQWRLPLFDDTVEYACLDVDLMGATTTLLYIFLFFGSYRQSIISFFGTKS